MASRPFRHAFTWEGESLSKEAPSHPFSDRWGPFEYTMKIMIVANPLEQFQIIPIIPLPFGDVDISFQLFTLRNVGGWVLRLVDEVHLE